MNATTNGVGISEDMTATAQADGEGGIGVEMISICGSSKDDDGESSYKNSYRY